AWRQVAITSQKVSQLTATTGDFLATISSGDLWRPQELRQV
ncbi:hypothetical protein A2U01_0113257, partial [Trifolium medium]|nr:hypothetical protein [Trifolium medium]